MTVDDDLPGALDRLLREVRACTICASHLPLGPHPVVQAAPSARLLIIGQAPGTRVHESGVAWSDPSGERLRDWIGIDAATFYDPGKVALTPMGFCYPGRSLSGGDAPPRPECAPKWHKAIRAHLAEIRLTLLVGGYAQKAYLAGRATLTDAVRDFGSAPSGLFPLPHPSWRSTGWMRRNPWFETEVLPALRARVALALARGGAVRD